MRKAARRAHAARYYQSCKARSGPVRKVKVPATDEREERCAWAARDRQGASLESEAAPTARTAKVMQFREVRIELFGGGMKPSETHPKIHANEDLVASVFPRIKVTVSHLRLDEYLVLHVTPYVLKNSLKKGIEKKNLIDIRGTFQRRWLGVWEVYLRVALVSLQRRTCSHLLRELLTSSLQLSGLFCHQVSSGLASAARKHFI
ncbi:hypothetical protein H671_4g12106 [Cricetulus griseus]|nr:hypothetical protein H671_4g12106 [Cricetulus griseus]